MFNCFRRPVIGALFFVLFFNSAKSQELDFGISGGGAYYLGDLNPGTPFLNTQPSFGALLRYNIDTRWSVKLGGTYGKVKGNASNGTPDIRDLDLNFSTNITDISAVAEFNFFPYFTGSERNRITPYIYAGISGFYYKTELYTKGNVTTSPNTLNFSIPFGLGAKVSLTSKLGLQVYWEMHKTFGDKLDGGLNGEIVVDDVFVGDPNTKDWFSFFGVSMTFKFNMPWSTKGYYQIHSAGKEWTR